MSDRKTGSEGGEQNPSMRGIIRPLALASQLGVTMGLLTVTTVLAGLFLGSWADRQLGTRPLMTLAFLLVGILVGVLGTINLAYSSLRELDSAAARNEEPRRVFSMRDLGQALLLVAQLALVTLIPVGLGLGLGTWLDRVAGAQPLFTIALTLISAAASLAAVLSVTRRASRRAGPKT